MVSMSYFLWVGELRRVKSTPRIGVTRKMGVEPFGCSAKAATVKSKKSRMSWPFHIADNADPSFFLETQEFAESANPTRVRARAAERLSV
jgi:hypothetical protein